MTALTLPEDILQQEPSVLLYTLVSAYLEHTPPKPATNPSPACPTTSTR